MAHHAVHQSYGQLMFHANSRALHGIETDIAAFLHHLLILLTGIFGRENTTETKHLLRVDRPDAGVVERCALSDAILFHARHDVAIGVEVVVHTAPCVLHRAPCGGAALVYHIAVEACPRRDDTRVGDIYRRREQLVLAHDIGFETQVMAVEKRLAVETEPAERRQSALHDELMSGAVEVDGVVYLVFLPVVVAAVVVYHVDVVAAAEVLVGQVQSVVEQIVVGIGENDIFAACVFHTVVARRRNTFVLLLYQSEVRILPAILLADSHRTVLRTVAHENHLILTVVQSLSEDRVKAFPQILLHVIHGDNDRDVGKSSLPRTPSEGGGHWLGIYFMSYF